MNVIIASKNPAKIEGAKRAFGRMFADQPFTFEGVDAASGVSAQPMSEAETKQGAVNRAHHAQTARPEADFWVGLEGGIQPDENGFLSHGWVCVLSRNKQGLGRSASFYLPAKIADLIKDGMELAQADDMVFKRSGSNKDEGAVGIMTHKVIDRITAFEHACILALIPFRNTDLF